MSDRGELKGLASKRAALQGRTILNSLGGGFAGMLAALLLAGMVLPFYFLGIIFGGFSAAYFQQGPIGTSVKVGSFAGAISTVPIFFLISFLVLIGIGPLSLLLPIQTVLAAFGLALIDAVYLLVGIFIVGLFSNTYFGAMGGMIAGLMFE